MKKTIIAVLLTVLVSSLVLMGCAPQTPAPAPAPAPAPSGSPSSSPSASPKEATTPTAEPANKPSAASTKTWTIRLSTAIPPNGWGVVNGANILAEKVAKATNGRVKVDVYGASTLAKQVDEWQAVKNGVAGSAIAVHGLFPGMTPYGDVISLPFMPFKSGAQASAVFWKLYEKMPTVQAQFKDSKIWMVFSSDPYFLINSKRPVKTLDDFKGLKLRILGGPPTEQFKALGATPMSMGMGDTYINIQKGVIDGMTTCWEALTSFRQYEVVKYYTLGAPFHGAYFTLPINMDLWNSMPKDVQDQLMSVGGLEGSKFWGGVWDSAAVAVKKNIEAGKFTYEPYTVPDEAYQKWVEAAGKPLWESWVKNLESQGYKDAREVLNTALELAKTTE